MRRIGIECEGLEGKRWGVGKTLIQLLQELSSRPQLQADFKFYLYFKNDIPADETLNSSLFEKRILKLPFLPPSYNVFYHILVPLFYFIDRLDGIFFPSYMLPAFFIGRSLVVLTNDIFYEAHSGNLPLRYRLSYRLFTWWAAKRSKILTISQFAKKEIAQFYNIDEREIFVNPWGMNQDFAKMVYNDQQLAAVREKYGIKRDLIFSWGQAFPRRHIKEAIQAFAIIASRFPTIQYLVACTDKYNPLVLEELINAINNRLGRRAIIYKEYIEQDDLQRLIKIAKLIIYISTSEAMGLPPIEGLLSGVPPLVADTGLTREIFADNAFFVKDPNNINEIAAKIIDALTNERQRRQILVYGAQLSQKFCWHRQADNFIKILKEIF